MSCTGDTKRRGLRVLLDFFEGEEFNLVSVDKQMAEDTPLLEIRTFPPAHLTELQHLQGFFSWFYKG